MLTPPRWEIIEAMQAGTPLFEDERHRLILGNEVKTYNVVKALVKEGYIVLATDEPGCYHLTEKGREAKRVGASKRNVKRPTPMAIYLGAEPKRSERMARIDQATAPFGGRSEAFQMLGDGTLKLVRVK